jgi:hypothetical protein
MTSPLKRGEAGDWFCWLIMKGLVLLEEEKGVENFESFVGEGRWRRERRLVDNSWL